MRTWAWVMVGLLWGGIVSAQTTTWRLAWDMPEAVGLSQGFVYSLSVDGAAAAPLGATCVVRAAGGSTCSAALPPMTTGTHTLRVTASNAFGSATSAPYTGASPSAPLNLTVTLTVVIQ